MCLGQEICDNAIDDDGDGLIDLNDDDCDCLTFLPSSLVPNQSFEDRTCCPTQNAMLNCAVGWIQASSPTTDYVHTCGNYLGNTNIPAFAPLPFPDGEGAVGFRDGQKDVGPDYKEYVGACLTESMQAGVSYRLDFFVGFRNDIIGNKSLDIAIFGSDNCARLPFGGGSITVGCPANTPYYDEIDVRFVSGSNEWVSISFEFIPTKPYEVIIIGPACADNPNYIHDPYFYVDGLTLAETAQFGIPLDEVEGSICNDDLVLSIDSEPGQTYQWYKDGIALPGETNPDLNLITTPEVAGNYLVVINLPDGCISSRAYNVRVPPYYAEHSATICENETYFVGDVPFTDAGIHETTIPASDGCDSIVTLTLDVTPNTEAWIEDFLCEGEEYSFLDIFTSEAGNYESILTNSLGCDSIVTVELSEIPALETFVLAEEIEIDLGTIINLSPEYSDPRITDFEWYDELDQLLSNEVELSNFIPTENTTITLVGIDQNGCKVVHEIKVRINKSTAVLHFPNVFSPDGNQINDLFTFVATPALLSVESFQIYDRWGNLLFSDTPYLEFLQYRGWDGFYNGKIAEQGVYGYKTEATFIDGSKKVFIGDFTLIR